MHIGVYFIYKLYDRTEGNRFVLFRESVYSVFSLQKKTLIWIKKQSSWWSYRKGVLEVQFICGIKKHD